MTNIIQGIGKNHLLTGIVSVLAGAMSAIAISWYAGQAGYRQYAEGVPPLLSLMIFFVLGAVPAVALVHYRLVTPTIVYGLVPILWLQAEASPGSGEPLVAFTVLLAPIAVVLMVLVAAGESRHRGRPTD